MSETSEIQLRSHEQKQLIEFLPKVAEEMEAIELNTVSDHAEQMLEVVSDADGIVEADDAVWESVVQGLRNDRFLERDDVKKNRAAWLRAKLARRLELSAMKMGFTSQVPLGAMVTGTQPTKPDRKA